MRRRSRCRRSRAVPATWAVGRDIPHEPAVDEDGIWRFAGLGAKDPDARDITLYETILSGEIGDPEDPDDNIAHVLTATDVSSGTILDGVSVTAHRLLYDEPFRHLSAGVFIWTNDGEQAITFQRADDAPAGTPEVLMTFKGINLVTLEFRKLPDQ
ncbi:MAG: hypothetical protein V3T53_05245 [Phycisphaerales bacterium]